MSQIQEYLTAFFQHEELKRQMVQHTVFEEKNACFASSSLSLSPPLAAALKQAGITRLYTHQAKALNAAVQGKDIIVTSPTASGKSMVYTLPVLERFLQNPNSRALYIFPLKALARDQYAVLQNLIKDWNIKPDIALYDGDCTPYERQKIRKKPPHILRQAYTPARHKSQAMNMKCMPPWKPYAKE